MYLHVRGSGMHLLRQNKLSTRSLLSRSNTMLSRRSNFDGGSCLPLVYSRPLMLGMATNALSTTIDFSKENVEEGVVDSPPSRGLVRMPIYSPSPLK